MLFRRKRNDPEYTTYEADDFYYYEQYMNETPSPRKTFKKPSTKQEDYYGFDDGNVVDKERRFNTSVKVIIGLIVYILFITIGIFSTTSITNEIGEKRAQVINLSILEERESFYKLRDQYYVIKSIIAATNEIDEAFLQSSDDDLFKISTQYQDILPQIDKMLPMARAIVVDIKYNSLKKQAESIYESIAIYLQKMGTALIEKNQETFEEALTWKDKYFYDFEQFRLNMIEFSKIVKIEDKSLTEDLPEIFSLTGETDSYYEPPQSDEVSE